MTTYMHLANSTQTGCTIIAFLYNLHIFCAPVLKTLPQISCPFDVNETTFVLTVKRTSVCRIVALILILQDLVSLTISRLHVSYKCSVYSVCFCLELTGTFLCSGLCCSKFLKRHGNCYLKPTKSCKFQTKLSYISFGWGNFYINKNNSSGYNIICAPGQNYSAFYTLSPFQDLSYF